jgi:hypothetical protein
MASRIALLEGGSRMFRRMVYTGFRFMTVAASGLVLATTCSSAEIREAVLAGVEVATDRWLESAEDDDVSFSDWLSSELDD